MNDEEKQTVASPIEPVVMLQLKGYTISLAIEKGMSHSDNHHCPECGCDWYGNKNYCGDGHRTCVDCGQEYWTGIKYENTAKRRELQ